MMAQKTITIGTRGSSLALIQAEMTREALKRVYPEYNVQIRVITTTGDRRTDLPLDQVAKTTGLGDKGVFMKEIEQELAEGTIDCAVHSLKDMPGVLEDEFELAAVLPRANVEDVLVFKPESLSLCHNIATGSVRRRLMGQLFWGNKVHFDMLRGNVTTRLSKLAVHSDWDAIILARAGLERLGLFDSKCMVDGVPMSMVVLPLDHFVPAAGQGIIGIEIRKNDNRMREILTSINHVSTYRQACAEREFLRLLNAGCSTPVGVHASCEGESMLLRVLYFPDQLARLSVFSSCLTGPANQPELLAQQMWHRFQESRIVNGD